MFVGFFGRDGNGVHRVIDKKRRTRDGNILPVVGRVWKKVASAEASDVTLSGLEFFAGQVVKLNGAEKVAAEAVPLLRQTENRAVLGHRESLGESVRQAQPWALMLDASRGVSIPVPSLELGCKLGACNLGIISCREFWVLGQEPYGSFVPSDSMKIEVTRGEIVESVHYVDIVVAGG